MKDALANTLVLGIAATIVGVTIGLGIGILAALRPYSKFDTAATTGAFVGISIPPFVSAVLLQLFFAVYMTKWLRPRPSRSCPRRASTRPATRASTRCCGPST